MFFISQMNFIMCLKPASEHCSYLCFYRQAAGEERCLPPARAAAGEQRPKRVLSEGVHLPSPSDTERLLSLSVPRVRLHTRIFS